MAVLKPVFNESSLVVIAWDKAYDLSAIELDAPIGFLNGKATPYVIGTQFIGILASVNYPRNIVNVAPIKIGFTYIVKVTGAVVIGDKVTPSLGGNFVKSSDGELMIIPNIDQQPYKDNSVYYALGISKPSGGGGSYELPIATENILGGVKSGTHTETDVTGVMSVTTGSDTNQIPTNFHVTENHYTKEESEVGSDTKLGEMDIRSTKIEFYGENDLYNYYNVNNGEILTDITQANVTKKQVMFLSASKRDSASVVYFHEDYLVGRPQVTNIEVLQEFYLNINGMRFNTSKYKIPVDTGYNITYNGKITLEGNSINTNENNFVENSKSGTYDTRAFDNSNTDHMFIRARIEIVSTSTREMNVIADPTSKLFALKMTSSHILSAMKIQPLYFQDTKAVILQGQNTRYENEAKEYYYRQQNFLTIGGYTPQITIGR